MIRNPLKRFADSFEIVLTRRNACVILVLAFFGELAEWFKAPVLKTGVSERNRGFESHILRFGIFEDTQQHTDKCPIVQKTAVGASHHGEVPKRLKGHPWKGCRPLIAVRGFKSLLLRPKPDDTCRRVFCCSGSFCIKNPAGICPRDRLVLNVSMLRHPRRFCKRCIPRGNTRARASRLRLPHRRSGNATAHIGCR